MGDSVVPLIGFILTIYLVFSVAPIATTITAPGQMYILVTTKLELLVISTFFIQLDEPIDCADFHGSTAFSRKTDRVGSPSRAGLWIIRLIFSGEGNASA